MTFHAGQKMAASDADQILTTSSQFVGAVAGNTVVLTSSTVDITDPFTITTQYANTKFALWAVYDVQAGSAGTGVTFIGTATVDGVSLGPTGEAHLSAANGTRATVTEMWISTLPAAGAHIIKLQGVGNTYQIYSTHTKWHALVFGP